MEYLHNNKELFSDIIIAASDTLNISPAIIEKDYYVTLLLKKITEKCPDIIFKGGTSLSKCFKIINRFSEDIDIGLNCDKATEGMRKRLKSFIKEAIDELGFELTNADNIFTRTYYNKYQIKYPVNEETYFIKPYLYVETAIFMRPYPFEIKKADTYIYRFLYKNNHDGLIEKYSLFPFNIKVQTLERTFIDKLFALGDYYLTGKTKGYSRHLYDLYKIMPEIDFDSDFFSLFNEVKEIRSRDTDCPSAKPGESLKELLEKIYTTDYFRSDYDDVTKELLFEAVSYSTVKENLKDIIGKVF